MPVLFVRLDPDGIARAKFLDWAVPSADQPKPEMTRRVWPKGWVCHAVLAPGSNVTVAPLRLPLPQNGQSILTWPVK